MSDAEELKDKLDKAFIRQKKLWHSLKNPNNANAPANTSNNKDYEEKMKRLEEEYICRCEMQIEARKIAEVALEEKKLEHDTAKREMKALQEEIALLKEEKRSLETKVKLSSNRNAPQKAEGRLKKEEPLVVETKPVEKRKRSRKRKEKPLVVETKPVQKAKRSRRKKDKPSIKRRALRPVQEEIIDSDWESAEDEKKYLNEMQSLLNETKAKRKSRKKKTKEVDQEELQDITLQLDEMRGLLEDAQVEMLRMKSKYEGALAIARMEGTNDATRRPRSPRRARSPRGSRSPRYGPAFEDRYTPLNDAYPDIPLYSLERRMVEELPREQFIPYPDGLI